MTPGVGRIPFAAGRRPFIGHAASFLDDPLGFLVSLADHGPLCRIQLGPLTIVVVNDAELVRAVLLDDLSFDKGGPFYDRSREIAGNGLGTCPHSEHRRQRRLCQPAFRSDRIRGYSEIMTASIEALFERWHDQAEIDVIAEMSALTVDIAVRTMFSTSLPDTLIRQAAQDLRVIAEGLFRRTVLPPAISRLPTLENRRFIKAHRRVRAIAADLILERRASGGDHGDLLSALLSARDRSISGDAVRLSDRELVDQIFTFFLAGAETTASALSWALQLLTEHPDTANTVFTEVDSVLRARTATFDDLPDLPAVTHVLLETLRLYPPGWLLTRTVSRRTALRGYSIPEGAVVAVSPHTAHRNAGFYPRSHEFMPDRWATTPPDRLNYLPFGAGSRKCIGDQFALTEAALALGSITARWRLTALGERPATVALRDLPAPRTLPMRLTRRSRDRPGAVGTPATRT